MGSSFGLLVIILIFLPNVTFSQVIPSLPRNAQACEYWVDLEVSPDPSKLLLKGSVSILIELLEDTDEILLNSQNLTIIRAIINSNQLSTVKHINNHTISVKSPTKLPGGFHRLMIEYQLKDINLGSGMVPNGIMRESYNDTDGTIRYVVSTQGEEFAASRYVPCFDEVSSKVPWNVILRHEAKYTALSNGDLLERKDLGNGLVASHFHVTPPMSAYLFTICVSEFENITTTLKDGIRLSVWMTPKEMLEQNGSQILQNLKESVEFLNSVLKPSYSLPKMDVFFAPWIGWAMENWGLITGQANLEPGVLQHELSHQWFGDLVTAKSWDHYWLNEGFATYWEKKNMPNETLNSIVDRLRSIENEKTNKPYSIVAPHFNEIGPPKARYEKGGALLYMLEGLVGKENLWMIMNEYLDQHLYDSAVTSDFFKAFPFFNAQKGDIAKINITEFGVQWTTQPGYPIINVSYDKQDANYILTQKSSASNDQRWHIPVFVVDFAKCQETDYVLVPFTANLDAVIIPKHVFPTFFLANSGYGLYQIDYDLETFMDNLKVFKQDKCAHHETAKLQLLIDGLSSENKKIRATAKSYGQKYFPGLGIFDDEEQKPLHPHAHIKHFKFF